MNMLIAGVTIWSLVHLMKSLTPNVRGAIIARMGRGPHQGLVALLLLGSVALMVFGWRSIPPEFAYSPPSWGRHLNMAMMYIAILLFGAAQGNSRIRQWLRHPMLTGMLVWSVGHLLANGDNRSLVLFGGLGLWALISIFTISRNEGAWQKPDSRASAVKEIRLLGIAAILYAALFWGHEWFAGVALGA